jgi:cytidylate kinase
MAQYCISGFNCCLFAYGQTGSGKTYTMTGKISSDICSETGIQLRVMGYLFGLLSKSREISFQVRCCYFEIYNEQIFDLVLDEVILVSFQSMAKTSKYGRT